MKNERLHYRLFGVAKYLGLLERGLINSEEVRGLKCDIQDIHFLLLLQNLRRKENGEDLKRPSKNKNKEEQNREKKRREKKKEKHKLRFNWLKEEEK